jgi:predicted RNA-binding Zn-ribbon protein involved in translation (DUF1610 family)
MLDCSMADPLDDSVSLTWLEHHLKPEGFVCWHCDGLIIARCSRARTIAETVDASVCK